MKSDNLNWIILLWHNFHNDLTQKSVSRGPHLVKSNRNRILSDPSSVWDSSCSDLRRCTNVVYEDPCQIRWLISDLPCKLIGRGSYIQKYFCGACLYGSGSDITYSILGRIPLYRNFYMLLLCDLLMVVALSLYVIDLHTVFLRLCHIRFRVRVISAIFLNHLEAMSLSDLASSLIFPSGIFI